jgi:hypothetical protein
LIESWYFTLDWIPNRWLSQLRTVPLIDLGPTTFIYGESRYLLTSLDLQIVSQILEASEEAPCLAMSLKLEMPVVR